DAVQETQILEQNSANSHSNHSFQKLCIRWNARYLLPILVNLFFLADTFLIYWKADFRYENLGNSDELIDRKIFPTNVWHGADVVLPVGFLWSTGILFCALFQDLTQWNDIKMYSVVRAD